MTHKSLLKFGFLCCALCPFFVNGQKRGSNAEEIKKIETVIQNSGEMAYKYMLTAKYPNGEGDHLDGKIYVGGDEKLMYNANDAFTMLYNDKWYFKADHRKKTVVIVNLQKHLTKDYKAGVEKDIFSTSALNLFFDSIVAKYATVQALKKSGDTVQMVLSFPSKSPIKTINVAYDEGKKILTGYSIQTFQQWPTNEFGKNKGTTQTMVCSNFIRVENNSEYRMDKFFTVKKDKAVLKKYKKYKIITEL